ncbi:MAG: TonB-dependent receptor [Acidobacteria bacterium]|nr:TonB-dependent receptor [Acidobacteriota bacterium]
MRRFSYIFLITLFISAISGITFGDEINGEALTKKKDPIFSQGKKKRKRARKRLRTSTYGAIRGYILDPEKSVIPGITVTLENLKTHQVITGVTNDQGVYEFRMLPFGRYLLRIEVEGFKPIKKKIEISSTTPIEQNFQLKLGELSEQIVVTATKRPEFLDNVPVPTTVISDDLIRKKAAENLLEAIKGTSGIKVQTTCSICNAAEIRVYGLSGSHVQLLIDGMPVYSGLATVYGLSMIPTEDIQQIEVVKSAGSSLYGSDALVGMVNIVTKPITSKPSFHFSTKYGSFNTQAYNMSLSGKYKRIGGRFTFQRNSSDGIDINHDGISDQVRYARNTYSAKIGLDISKRYQSQLTFHINYYDENRLGGPKGSTGENPAAITENIITHRTELFGNWSFKPDEASDITVRANWSEHHQNALYELNWYLATDTLGVLDVQYNRFLLKRHFITAGYMYKKEEIAESRRFGKAELEQSGIYLQDEIKLTEDFSFLLGGRYDHHTQFGDYFSPRGSLMYKPNDKITIRASFGTGFKAPGIFFEEMHYCPGGFRYEVVRNPNLRPETSRTYNINFVYKVPRLRAEFALFRTTVKDMIQGKIIGEDEAINKLVYSYVNVGKARAQGAEFILSGSPFSNLSFSFGYTFLDAMDLAEGKPLPFRSKHSADLNITYRKAGWDIFLEGELVGSMLTQEVLRTDEGGEIVREWRSPSYSIWNLHLTRKIGKHYELRFGVDNIFDYVQWDVTTKDTEYVWGPLRPRFLFVGGTIHF